MEKAKGSLVRQFDKIFLGVALAALGAFAYVDHVAYKPLGELDEAQKAALSVKGALDAEHPDKAPPPIADYFLKPDDAWMNAVSNFKASDWASSYFTNVKAIEIKTPMVRMRELQQKCAWKAPKLDVAAINVDIGSLDVHIMILPLDWREYPREEVLKQTFFVKDNQPYLENTFDKLVLERKAPSNKGGEKTNWEAVTEWAPQAGQTSFRYVDRDIVPKGTFAYRVAGQTRKVPFGRKDTEAVTSPDKSAKTLDIWRLALKWIVLNASQERRPEATIELSKYEYSKGKWFTREFKVWEDPDPLRIGGEFRLDPKSFEREWNFLFEGVDYNTRFKVKKVVPNTPRQWISRRHKHDPKDPAKFTVEELPKKYMTDVLIYVDEQNEEHELVRAVPVLEEPCPKCAARVRPFR